MKPPFNLDDLSLFLEVARSGSLAAAARQSGLSVPTLGRRMTRLEAQSGKRLFLRGAQGYALTADGRALAEEASDLRRASERVARWRDAGTSAVRVRITAGSWTARFIARHIGAVWSDGAAWAPEFLAASRMVDIARRQADIGIRNHRPEQDWLAGRRTARIGYAIYAAHAELGGYIGLPREASDTPSSRWVWQHHADEVALQVNTPQIALELALAGLGRVVLPTFVGDAEDALTRLSAPIDALAHDEWLVSHHEARHDPPVRAAIDAVAELLSDPSLRAPAA